MNISPFSLLLKGIFRGISSRIHRALFKGQYPTFLLLAVTERCNCRCSMCHIWRKESPAEPSPDLIRTIFHDPLWKQTRILSLTGGEPFLRQDLAEVILAGAELLPRLERISMPTNGLLPDRIEAITRDVLNRLPAHIDLKIGVSLDGPSEVHNAMRRIPGAHERALKTVQALHSLESERFSVGILSLLTKENSPYLRKCHEHFSTLTDQITYTLGTESEFFQNVSDPETLLTPEAEAQIIGFTQDVLIRQYPEKAYLYYKYRDHLLQNRRTYPCLAGYRSAYVDSAGRLFPCHYVGEEFSFGRYEPGVASLEKEWFSGNGIRRRLEENTYCDNCSNNCDSRNLIQEDFWNFFGFLLTHPSVPLRALMKILRRRGKV